MIAGTGAGVRGHNRAGSAAELSGRLLPRAARVEGDDVNEMILRGRVWFAGEPAEEAARQVELGHRTWARWPPTSSASDSAC